MSNQIEVAEYILGKGVPIHNNGQVESKTVISLFAPSSKNRVQTAKIKQTFYRAMKANQSSLSEEEMKRAREEAEKNKAKSGSQKELSGKDVIQMILMSDEDYGDFQYQFTQMFLSGCAGFDGTDIKMTNPLLDSISDADLDGMIAAYLENFMLSSLVK